MVTNRLDGVTKYRLSAYHIFCPQREETAAAIVEFRHSQEILQMAAAVTSRCGSIFLVRPTK